MIENRNNSLRTLWIIKIKRVSKKKENLIKRVRVRNQRRRLLILHRIKLTKVTVQIVLWKIWSCLRKMLEATSKIKKVEEEE